MTEIRPAKSNLWEPIIGDTFESFLKFVRNLSVLSIELFSSNLNSPPICFANFLAKKSPPPVPSFFLAATPLKPFSKIFLFSFLAIFLPSSNILIPLLVIARPISSSF